MEVGVVHLDSRSRHGVLGSRSHRPTIFCLTLRGYRRGRQGRESFCPAYTVDELDRLASPFFGGLQKQ